MSAYLAVLRQADQLHPFHKVNTARGPKLDNMPSLADSLASPLESSLNQTILREVLDTGFEKQSHRETPEETVVPAPPSSTAPEASSTDGDSFLERQVAFFEKVSAYSRSLPTKAADSATATGGIVGKWWFFLTGHRVFGPLVRSHVRSHIRTILTRLRVHYIAQRAALNPATDEGQRHRKLLSEVIDDVTQFLERHTDISKVSKGRGQLAGLSGGVFRLGIPGGASLLIGRLAYERLGPVAELFESLVQGEFDVGRLDGWLALGALGALVALLVLISAVGAYFIMEMMAFYSKRSLLVGMPILSFEREESLAGRLSADHLEKSLFRQLGYKQPDQSRQNLWYRRTYILLGAAIGGWAAFLIARLT